MTDFEKIQATIDSPGMKLIARELRGIHKGVYKRYRACGPDELVHLQQLQKLIDTTLPGILDRLMNKHLQKHEKKTWIVADWLRKVLK